LRNLAEFDVQESVALPSLMLQVMVLAMPEIYFFKQGVSLTVDHPDSPAR